MMNKTTGPLEALGVAYTTRILSEMIRINSVVGNEGTLADYIHDELNRLGIESQLAEVEPGRPNVYGRIIGTRPGKHLHLNGHMDTVPVCEGWTMDPFGAEIKDGRMYGLGACDMKAGLACMMDVLRAFKLTGSGFAGTLSFSAVIDEEAYSKGAKALLQTGPANIDAMLIAEPYSGDADMPIPLGITGKVLYDITVKGRAAHGFRPHKGVNAVEEAARIIAALDQLSMVEHPDFGKGNYCTLMIAGGYEVYSVVVPDRCRFEVNRMLVPGETTQTALEDMRRLIRSLGLRAEVDVRLKAPKYESFVMDPGESIVGILKDVYSQVMGTPPQFAYSAAITDANVFAGEAHIPCVHLGPARGNVHQPDEHVRLDWLAPTSKMIAMIAGRFLL